MDPNDLAWLLIGAGIGAGLGIPGGWFMAWWSSRRDDAARTDAERGDD